MGTTSAPPSPRARPSFFPGMKVSGATFLCPNQCEDQVAPGKPSHQQTAFSSSGEAPSLSPFSCCKVCCGGRGCLRRNGSSPLPHLFWSPDLETWPPGCGTSPSELGWPSVLCGVGVGWGAGWPSVFSCLYERKLAVSQQTQEPSVARGRPLHQGEARGGWGGEVGKWSPLLPAETFLFGLLQPFPLRMTTITMTNH